MKEAFAYKIFPAEWLELIGTAYDPETGTDIPQYTSHITDAMTVQLTSEEEEMYLGRNIQKYTVWDPTLKIKSGDRFHLCMDGFPCSGDADEVFRVKKYETFQTVWTNVNSPI